MKIICIGRNYLAHVKELDNALPTEPMFFMKPETALLPAGEPFPYPDFSKEVNYETELVLHICKTGKAIDEKMASEYYDAITVGIDFTARDLQNQCKAKGHPWEIAKAFDSSAPMGSFKKISGLKHPEDIAFGMKLNGEWRQQGHSRDMIFSFDRIIAHVSRFVTLNEGDFIFTGTPQGVGEVHVGDTLELFLEDESLFSFCIK
ncbi:MAG: fumarylacetoacetate hydrolase family protein [Bacteroidales bacterium]|nr:fumarylacetoacetate hydrolase family protein [Bacteroidales bacterium]